MADTSLKNKRTHVDKLFLSLPLSLTHTHAKTPALTESELLI